MLVHNGHNENFLRLSDAENAVRETAQDFPANRILQQGATLRIPEDLGNGGFDLVAEPITESG